MAAGLAGSLAVHGGLLALVVAYGAVPDMGFELQLPSEVEFGLTEAADLLAARTEPPAAPEPAAPEAAGGQGPGPSDGGAGEADAGVPDAGRRRPDAGRHSPDAGPSDGGAGDGGADPAALVASAEDGTSRIPPGAQIALRIDVERVRASPLRDDVRMLLSRNPDWQALLEGSGIDPVDDVDRIMLASPNLSRSRWVIAGRHAGEDDQLVRAAVQRLGEARGEPVSWELQHGVQVAPWHDADETDRVIALVGPRHFTISRPEDLPRVLAVAQARQQEDAQAPERDDESWADALLSMEEDEAISVEVEGARRFVRVPEGSEMEGRIPDRARAAVTQARGGLVVTGSLRFDDDAQAADSLSYWDERRARLAQNSLVRFAGMSAPLAQMQVSTDGRWIRFRTRLGLDQTRFLLGYLERQLAAYARAQEARRAAPPPPDSDPGTETNQGAPRSATPPSPPPEAPPRRAPGGSGPRPAR